MASPFQPTTPPGPSRRVYRFDAFELDVRAGELRKRGIRLRARQQTLQILQILLEKPGELVLRQEIRDRLWPADTVVEFDHSINAAVQKLRDVLGESAENPRYIETLKGRGYRLLASVEVDSIELKRDLPHMVVMPARPSDVIEPVALPAPRQKRTWAVAAAGLVVATLCTAWVYSRTRTAETRNWTFPLGALELPVVSPDGSSVVYRKAAGLVLRRLDSLSDVSLAGAGRPIDLPAWSPDSTRIVYPTLTGVVTMRVPDGPPTPICPLPWPTRGLSWGAADNIIVAVSKAGRTELMLVPGSGGPPVRVEVSGLDGGRFFQPEFLPNGEDVLFGWNRDGDEQLGLYLATITKGEVVRGPFLLRQSQTTGRYSPAGGGSLLFIENDILYAQKLSVTNGRLEGDARRVVDRVFSVPGFRRPHFSVSASGVLAWRSGTAALAQPTWFDRSGRVIGTTGPAWDATSASLGPDQKHLLITGSNWRTILVDTGESGTTPLPGIFGVRWMPDRSGLLHQDRSDGVSTRLLVRSAHGGPEKEVARIPGLVAVQEVSPDGKTVLYTTAKWSLHSARIDGTSPADGTPLVKSEYSIFNAHFSPDGRWIVYSEFSDGAKRVYVQRFPYGGIRKQISSEGAESPVWRGDSKEILYRAGGKIYSVPVRTTGDELDAGAPVVLFEVHYPISLKGNSEPLAVTKDGSRILFLEATPDPEERMSHVMTAWERLLEH